MFLFRSDFDEWNQIFVALSQICEALVEVHESNDGRSLYSDCSSYDSILTKTFNIINHKPFYGKNIGFQFCPSMRPIIKFIVLSMASYYSFYFKSKPKILRVLRFPISFSKYHLSPKKRAVKYLHASNNSTTEFCRVNSKNISTFRNKLSKFIFSLSGFSMRDRSCSLFRSLLHLRLRSTKSSKSLPNRYRFTAKSWTSWLTFQFQRVTRESVPFAVGY